MPRNVVHEDEHAKRTKSALSIEEMFRWRYLWLPAAVLISPIDYARAGRRMEEYGNVGSTLELCGGPLPLSGLYRRPSDVLVVSDFDHLQLRRQKAISDLFAKLLRKENNKHYVVLNNFQLPFADGSFRNVVSVNGLGELNSEILRVLSDGGIYIESAFGMAVVYEKRDGSLTPIRGNSVKTI